MKEIPTVFKVPQYMEARINPREQVKLRLAIRFPRPFSCSLFINALELE